MADKPEWKGNSAMKENADRTWPKIQEFFDSLNSEQRNAVKKFVEFWTNNIGSGHKNIWRMSVILLDVKRSRYDEENG